MVHTARSASTPAREDVAARVVHPVAGAAAALRRTRDRVNMRLTKIGLSLHGAAGGSNEGAGGVNEEIRFNRAADWVESLEARLPRLGASFCLSAAAADMRSESATESASETATKTTGDATTEAREPEVDAPPDVEPHYQLRSNPTRLSVVLPEIDTLEFFNDLEIPISISWADGWGGGEEAPSVPPGGACAVWPQLPPARRGLRRHPSTPRCIERYPGGRGRVLRLRGTSAENPFRQSLTHTHTLTW